MIKLFLKHTLIDYAINSFFDEAITNFTEIHLRIYGRDLTDKYLNLKIHKVIDNIKILEVGELARWKGCVSDVNGVIIDMKLVYYNNANPYCVKVEFNDGSIIIGGMLDHTVVLFE